MTSEFITPSDEVPEAALNPDEREHLRSVTTPEWEDTRATATVFGDARQWSAPLTSFVGRESELTELTMLLATTRLLTLVGPPGVGKTRLAMEITHQRKADYSDGVWIVELGLVSSDGDDGLVGAIADAIGITRSDEVPVIDVLAEHLDDGNILLVLDNCEHLLEQCAMLAERLLTRCSGLRILATSREPLRAHGEILFSVGPLTLPSFSSQSSRSALMASDAVRLFLQRAHDATRDFTLHPSNGALIAEICRRLDGMPLAIELAAQRIRMMPLEEILQCLEDRFDLLSLGPRTATDRHSSLRSAIAWSYSLMPDVERVICRRLGVFAGGFSLAGAAAVCGGDGVPAESMLEQISHLVFRSLVTPATGGAVGRFRQFESIRAYGLALLEDAGELDRYMDKLADWLIELVSGLHYSVFPESRLIRLVESERDNLSSAVKWTATRDPERYATLVSALAMLEYQAGNIARGSDLVGSLLENPLQARLRVHALFPAGWLAYARKDYDEALRCAEEAVLLQWDEDAPMILAKSLNLLAVTWGQLGRQAEGQEMLRRCIELIRPLEQPGQVSMVARNLAWMLIKSGDSAEAMKILGEISDAQKPSNAPEHSGPVLHGFAVLALRAGDTERAEEIFIEAARNLVAEQFGVAGLAGGLEVIEGLAIAAARDHRPERALRLIGAVGAKRRKIGLLAEPWWKQQIEQAVLSASATLSGAEADAATRSGRKLTIDQAMSYAIDDVWTIPVDRQNSQRLVTKRERVVAQLVARGLTNRQIADQLSLSERTIESHLDHLRTKLQLTSRVEVALWASSESP